MDGFQPVYGLDGQSSLKVDVIHAAKYGERQYHAAHDEQVMVPSRPSGKLHNAGDKSIFILVGLLG
jgi:hypothetical protein